jgi:hypothetical protein
MNPMVAVTVTSGRGETVFAHPLSLTVEADPAHWVWCVVLLDESPFAPAMRSRYGHKVVISPTCGEPLVRNLLQVAAIIAGPAVLFLNSDDAVLTVSEYRGELAKDFLFRLPSHGCLTSLIHKTSFQRLAEAHGFAVPRSVTIGDIADLNRLAELRFPASLNLREPPQATLTVSLPRPTRSDQLDLLRQFAVAFSPLYRISSFKNGWRAPTATFIFASSTAEPGGLQCVRLPVASSAFGHRMSASRRAALQLLMSTGYFSL